MLKRIIALLTSLALILNYIQPAFAQDFSINQLPVPGAMVAVSTSFVPLALKGIIVNPQKPLELQFIVDTGKGSQDTTTVREESSRLVKYFLAGITIPEGDLWVNLSPYEKDRITTESLGQTELGRDLLAQDYILKQLTASLIYPEKDLGKEFWSRVYKKAQEKFGTTNIPVNTFNKVWILPDQAQVFEKGNAAYVTKSTLKVMLDEDYLAKKKHQSTQTASISSQIIREIVLPEIEKEVNTGKNFALLRQIYDALILAKWYKETIQNGLLDTIYTDKSKTTGVNLNDPSVKEQIYQRYLQAYKKGVFNYIKEDITTNGQAVPRKYFSGGLQLMPRVIKRDGDFAMINSDGAIDVVRVDLEKTNQLDVTNKNRLGKKTHDVRIDLIDRLRKEIASTCNVSLSGFGSIDIVSGNINKGTAIRDIFASSPEIKRVIYFGDEFFANATKEGNDVPILSEVLKAANSGHEVIPFSVDQDPEARNAEAKRNTVWIGAGPQAVRNVLKQIVMAIQKGQKQVVVKGVGPDINKEVVINLENTAFYFDIDGTLLDGGENISFDQEEIGASFIELLDRGIYLGLVSGASRLRKVRKIVDPLFEHLNRKSDMERFRLYANGAATRVTYDSEGVPNVENLVQPISSDDLKKVVSILKNFAADNFGLSGEEILAWKKWFNYSEDKGYGSLSRFPNMRFHFPSAGAEFNPKILTIEEADKAPDQENPVELTIPFIETRDGVQINIKLLPKEVDMAMTAPPVFILMGAPGSGKGTVGTLIADAMDLPHISLGETLRGLWEVDRLMPKENTLGARVLEDILSSDPQKYINGFILDSNPINEESHNEVLKILDKLGYRVAKYLNVGTIKENAKDRYIKRGPREGNSSPEEIADHFEKRYEQYYLNATIPVLRKAVLMGEDNVINFDNNGTYEDLKNQVRKKAKDLAEELKFINVEESSNQEVNSELEPIVNRIIEQINKYPGKRVVIGITGPSAVGKTNIVGTIRQMLNNKLGAGVDVLHQDSFFLPQTEIENRGIDMWKVESVDVEGVNRQIQRFRNEQSVSEPVLRKPSQGFVRIGRRQVDASRVLITEGVDVLNNDTEAHSALTAQCDIRIMISADKDDLKAWWIGREKSKPGNKTDQDIEEKWNKQIARNLDWRTKLWVSADYVINKGSSHEIQGTYVRSPFIKGESARRVHDIEDFNPVDSTSINASLKRLEERINGLSNDKKALGRNILDFLNRLASDHNIGWIDPLVRNESDFVFGFWDKDKNRLGLAIDFFNETDSDLLLRALFWYGAIALSGVEYQSISPAQVDIYSDLFGDSIEKDKTWIKERVKIYTHPRENQFKPFSQSEWKDLVVGDSEITTLVDKIHKLHGISKPKIAIITPTGKGGGVTVLAKEILEALANDSTGIDGKWYSLVRHENIDYWGISGAFQKAMMGQGSSEFTGSDIVKLQRAMEDNADGLDLQGYDYVVLHDPYSMGLAPLLRKKYPHLKIIWFNHGDISHINESALAYTQNVLGEANGVIFSWQQSYIPKKFIGAPNVFMMHGLNLNSYKNVDLPDSFVTATLKKYGLENDSTRPILLHVGRFNYSKDPLRTIGSFLRLKDNLKKQGSSVEPRLVLMGVAIGQRDWTMYRQLKKFIEQEGLGNDITIISSDNELTSFTPDQQGALIGVPFKVDSLSASDRSDLELNAFQRAASLGIHPALDEGFGLVISEALIKGTPVIASKVGGIPEQITDAEWLVDYKVKDPMNDPTNKNRYALLSSENWSDLLEAIKADPFAEEFASRASKVLNKERSIDLRGHIKDRFTLRGSLKEHLKLIYALELFEAWFADKPGIDMEDLRSNVKDYSGWFMRMLKNVPLNKFNEKALQISSQVQDLKKAIDERIETLLKINDFDEFSVDVRKWWESINVDSVPIVIFTIYEKLLAGGKDVSRISFILQQFNESNTEQLISILEDEAMVVPFSLKKLILPQICRSAIKGNLKAQEYLEKYLISLGINKDKELTSPRIREIGLSHWESVEFWVSLIADLVNTPQEEQVAGKLISNWITPTPTLIKFLADGGDLEDLIKRFNILIKNRKNLNQSDPIDLDLGFSLLRLDARHGSIKLPISYDEYLDLIKRSNSPNLNTPENELKAVAKMAEKVEDFVFKIHEAHPDYPVMVIGNNYYGGQVLLAPLEDRLTEEGMRVEYVRSSSGSAHFDPFYISPDLFSDNQLRYLIWHKPTVLMIDGTNSLPKENPVEGERIRLPHIADGYLGFRNYFIALSDAMGYTVVPEQYAISLEDLISLRSTPSFIRTVQHIRSILPQGYREDRTYGPGFSFWNSSSQPLPLRRVRQAWQTPENIVPENVIGFKAVFIQAELGNAEVPEVKHIPGYFDLPLIKTESANFDVRIDHDDSKGISLSPIRDINLKATRTFIRGDELVKNGQILLDYFGKGTIKIKDIKDVGAFLILGNHEIDTLYQFIDLYRSLMNDKQSPDIVVSGGYGRGTILLQRKLKNLYYQKGWVLPGQFEKMSEAALICDVLEKEGLPIEKIHLEEASRFTAENFEKSKTVLNTLKIDKNKPVVIFQTPTQRRRAVEDAKRLSKEGYAVAIAEENDSYQLNNFNDRDFVVTLYRLVGKNGMDGEVEIFDQFYKDHEIPSDIKVAYDVVKQKLVDLFQKKPYLLRYLPDSAMLINEDQTTLDSRTAENGGIDLNQINVNRTGRTINVQFNQNQLNELMQGGFEGFTPVIINITPIQNPATLLGVNLPKEEELLTKV